MVAVEERGVVVKDAKGALKRRHKDDVKPYYPPRLLSTESDDEGEEPVPTHVAEGAAAAAAVVPGDNSVEAAEENRGRAPGAGTETLSRRSGRSRNLPEHLSKDYEVYGLSKGRRGGK